MNSSRVAKNLRVRIARFSGDLSKGLCKPAQRFVGEMVYGIQAGCSVMLTEIARRLEESIELRKTHGRLSRNLQRPELERAVGNNLLRMAAGPPSTTYAESGSGEDWGLRNVSCSSLASRWRPPEVRPDIGPRRLPRTDRRRGADRDAHRGAMTGEVTTLARERCARASASAI